MSTRVIDGVRFVREASTGHWFPEDGDGRYYLYKDDVTMEDGDYRHWANAWAVFDTEEGIIDICRYLIGAARELLRVRAVSE